MTHPHTPRAAFMKTTPQQRKTGTWVQTERKSHQAWANLILRKPMAAAVLHRLVAEMGEENAVIISQALLAKMVGKSVETIKRALRDLDRERWIQIIRIGKGKECAYIVNDRVAWQDKRDNLRFSRFSATIIADYEDQNFDFDQETGELKQIPTLYPGEIQFPAGEGEFPPSQPSLDGLDPDLPVRHLTDQEEREMLERVGQKRLIE